MTFFYLSKALKIYSFNPITSNDRQRYTFETLDSVFIKYSKKELGTLDFWGVTIGNFC